MKTKATLIHLLFLTVLSTFSIQIAFGQEETAAAVPSAIQKSGTSGTLFASSFDSYVLSQDTGRNLKTKEFYLLKSQKQKSTAWILLGAGTAMIIGGGIGFNQNFDLDIFTPVDKGKDARANFFGYMILTGIITDLLSFPFFSSASHNKRMASSLSFENQQIYSFQNRFYAQNTIPVLTLKIKF